MATSLCKTDSAARPRPPPPHGLTRFNRRYVPRVPALLFGRVWLTLFCLVLLQQEKKGQGARACSTTPATPSAQKKYENTRPNPLLGHQGWPGEIAPSRQLDVEILGAFVGLSHLGEKNKKVLARPCIFFLLLCHGPRVFGRCARGWIRTAGRAGRGPCPLPVRHGSAGDEPALHAQRTSAARRGLRAIRSFLSLVPPARHCFRFRAPFSAHTVHILPAHAHVPSASR